MTAPFVADALGPRGRRQVKVATVASSVVVAGAVVVVVRRLSAQGQFAEGLWRPFTDPAVQRFLFLGLVATLKAAVVAMSLAIVVGGVMALGRLARSAPVRWLSGGYVEVFRAVPLILLIYFAGRGLPTLGIRAPVFWLLVFGLVAYNGAVLGEIFRAGILSLDRGQTDAAMAIGLGYWPTMLQVVIPQAARRMVPAIVSQLITLLKDTSLGYAVQLEELLRRSYILGEFEKNLLQSLFVVAVMYLFVNLALSRLARRLEVRQRRRYRAGSMGVSGVEDLAVLEAEPVSPRTGATSG